MDPAQNTVVSSKRKKPSVSSLNALPAMPDPNEVLFEKAGITPEHRAALLQKAFSTTEAALNAVETKTYQYRGEVLYSRPLTDHATRLRAAEQAKELAGLKRDVSPQIHVKMNVTLPEWASGDDDPVIDITPKTDP